MIRYRAAWVLPIATPPIRDGVVAVDGGRIAWVGPRDAAPAAPERDLGDALLLPGLVNVHTHLELTAMRGFLDGLDFREWIVTLQRAKVAVLDEAQMLDAARAGLQEAVAAGITCVADTCDSGVALRAMREAGVRGVMYQEVFGPDPVQCDAAMAALREKVAAHRAMSDDLRQVGVSPHAPFTVSDALFGRVMAFAREERLPVAVHIAESAAESAFVAHGAGPFAEGHRRRGIPVAPRAASPLALLEQLGVLGPHTLCIHCVQADAGDIGRLAASGSAVAHCPISNARLGHGTAPLAGLLAAGVRVGLGSDSMASNDRMHLLEEGRAAILAQRTRAAEARGPAPDEVLRLATLGGAAALGLDGRIGSLEPGKDADLAAFPLGDAAGAAEHDPAGAAIYAMGGAAARFVAVRGEVLVEHGTVRRHDPALAARVHATAQALAAWRRDQGISSG